MNISVCLLCSVEDLQTENDKLSNEVNELHNEVANARLTVSENEDLLKEAMQGQNKLQVLYETFISGQRCRQYLIGVVQGTVYFTTCGDHHRHFGCMGPGAMYVCMY